MFSYFGVYLILVNNNDLGVVAHIHPQQGRSSFKDVKLACILDRKSSYALH